MQRARAFASFALLFVGFAANRPSLALDPSRTLTQYAHRIWGLEEGLVEPTIYSILQTRNGYLWLGTQDGLIRFDGLRFRLFDESTEIPFPRSLVRSLYEDKRGDLWIGSVGSGLGRLSAQGEFRRYTTKDGLPSDDVFWVSSDAKGRLLLSTDRGLATFEQGRFRVFTAANGLPSNNLRFTCADRAGNQWVTGIDFGAGKWDGARFAAYQPAGAARSASGRVTALDCAQDGSVWVGANETLTQITSSGSHQFSTEDGLPEGPVSALTDSADGTVWIGTRDGVSRYRKSADGRREFSTYRTKDGLSHSSVLSLYLDRENSLWAGTKNGLDQFADGNVTPYTTHEGMPSNDIGPVLEDATGRIWAGTLTNGLTVFDGHRFQGLTTQNGLTDNHILSLALDRKGDMWVGTGDGLNELRDGRVIAKFSQQDGLSGKQIQALYIDSTGILWAGTDRGLGRFDGRRFRSDTQAMPDSPSSILAITGGQRTRLLVSTEPTGLYILRDEAFHRYPLPEVSQPISCYYFDQVKHIGWMGTQGSGLLRWQNGALTRIRVKDGLYDNRIYSILRDGETIFGWRQAKGFSVLPKPTWKALPRGNAAPSPAFPSVRGNYASSANRVSNPPPRKRATAGSGSRLPAGW